MNYAGQKEGDSTLNYVNLTLRVRVGGADVHTFTKGKTPTVINPQKRFRNVKACTVFQDTDHSMLV